MQHHKVSNGEGWILALTMRFVNYYDVIFQIDP